MKIFVLLLFAVMLPWVALFAQDFDSYTCSFKGKNLYGKVQKVNYGADVKVRVIGSNADLKVDTNVYSPRRCGEWKFVTYSPDIKVQFVAYNEDITIEFVKGYPGVNSHSSRGRSDKPNTYNCTYKGIALYGKVKFVEHFEDIKIKVVDHFSDIDVTFVEHFPDRCGEWQVVENFEDFKVKIVENFEDIKVRFVNNFPGIK